MLRVADFFCGAGGFSEGFRQKGFELAYALDNWEPATKTIRLYHPKCKVELADIRKLDSPRKIAASIPDVDVIIGSPPCVSFSYSNRAGKAGKSSGLELIQAFLRIVACKQKKGSLKYWIMENVPNAAKHIGDEYTWKELGLSGQGPCLQIPQRHVLNAVDFGVPQTRERLFAGDYPEPNKTHTEGNHLTVGDVFDALGNPLSPCSDDRVADPNYPIRIRASELTDHFYDTRIEEWKWKRSRRLKEDHGFMGRMAFPDELDRPSRTVLARRFFHGRETMIYGLDRDESGEYTSYRLPTIREIACFMSFPITYQFQGNTEASKHRLVGNAVACKQARALAQAILEKEDVDSPDFIPLPIVQASRDLTGITKEMRPPPKRPKDSRFARHVPYLKEEGFRVELTNRHSDFSSSEVVWSVTLHKGTGRRAKRWQFGFGAVCELLASSEPEIRCESTSRKDYRSRIDRFEKMLKKDFDSILPDAHTFQKIFTREFETNRVGPNKVLELIRDLVDEFFPKQGFSHVKITKGVGDAEVDPQNLPVRIAAGLFACEYAAFLVNNHR